MTSNGALAPADSASKAQDVSATAGKPAVQASEVGWLFVPQYYTFLNQNPGRLHCFYTKKSTLVHGTEQEDSTACFGQQEIHDKITSLGFQDCKVFVSNVDSQSSAAGGILIQVLGEMSNKGGPWRKFAQTFFLAEQPNGYFVLNDIFRYLKEDDEIEEEATEIDAALTTEIDKAERDGTEIQGTNKVDVSAVAQPGATPSVRPIAAATDATPAAPLPAATITDTSVAATEEAAPAAAKEEAAPAPAAAEETKAEAAPAPAAAPAPKELTPADAAAGWDTPAVKEETPKAAEAAPAAAPATNGDAAAAAPAAAAAAPATPAPAPAPAAPKTWANLAASNAKGWGSTASEAKGVSSSRPAVTSAPAPKPSAAAASSGAGASRQGGGSSALQAAQNQNHGGVFIKNVIVDKMPAEGLQAALEARFGPMKECQIIPTRACAFAEFVSVEAARKAIIMSLRPSEGGEGGVPVGNEGWTVTVEEKRKIGDRPAPRNTPGGAGAQGERGSGSSRGGAGGSGRGDYRGRGRGGGAGRGGRGGSAAAGASA